MSPWRLRTLRIIRYTSAIVALELCIMAQWEVLFAAHKPVAWIPLLPVTALTAWLWHVKPDVLIPADGICAKCGYNLTGNVSGICPECGSRISA
jgi:hypothetical protein